MGHGCCCVFAIVRSLTSAGSMRRRLKKSIRSSFASRPSLELYETDRGYSNTGSCPYSLNVVEKEFSEVCRDAQLSSICSSVLTFQCAGGLRSGGSWVSLSPSFVSSNCFWVRKAAPERSAPERSAPERSAAGKSAPESFVTQRIAPERSAPERFAPARNAPERFAQERSASGRCAPERSASGRFASERSASRRFASESFAPESIALEKLAPERSAQERSAPERSAPRRFAPESFAP